MPFRLARAFQNDPKKGLYVLQGSQPLSSAHNPIILSI